MSTRTALSLVFAGVLTLGCSKDADNRGPLERAGKAVDDTTQSAVLHTKVRLALLEGMGTDALRVEIDVYDDRVELSGKVREQRNVALAAELARSVAGVPRVDSRVELAPAEATEPTEKETAIADETLAARVRLKLLDELGDDALHITVGGTKSTIVLGGRVGDAAQRTRAESLARATTGVKDLENKIEVLSNPG